MVERILYIWSIRHPASGYVQGINDLVTPFLMVFLQDFVDTDVTRSNFEFESLDEKVRKEIEADSFWCMTKVVFFLLTHCARSKIIPNNVKNIKRRAKKQDKAMAYQRK